MSHATRPHGNLPEELRNEKERSYIVRTMSEWTINKNKKKEKKVGGSTWNEQK